MPARRPTPQTTAEAAAAFDRFGHNTLIEYELWQDACRRNFRTYTLFAFGALHYMQQNPQQWWWDEPIHNEYCDWLGERGEVWLSTRHRLRERMLLLSLLPRNVAKSVVSTCSFPSWLHLRDHNLCSYIDGYKLTFSTDFLGVIQRVMEGTDDGAWFAELYGNWKPPRGGDESRRWTLAMMTHMMRTDLRRKDPSFECVSVETGLTGRHPDTVHADDPVVEEKLTAEGDAWITLCHRHFAQMIPAMQPNGLLSLAMTRYTDNDPAVAAMRKEGVRNFANTGMTPRKRDFKLDLENGQWDVFFARGVDPKGRAVFPAVWPLARIRQYQRTHPTYAASQVQLDPMSGAHHPVNEDYLAKRWVSKEDLPPNLRHFLHFDTAFKPERKAKGDRSAIVHSAHTVDGTGKVYFFSSQHSQEWNENDFAQALGVKLLAMKADNQWPELMTDEISAGKSGLFATFLRKYIYEKFGIVTPRLVELSRSHNAKHARISAAAAFWAGDFVYLVNDGEGLDLLCNEMVAFPDEWEEHNDCSDAGADAFKMPEVYRPGRLQTTQADERRAYRGRPYDELLKSNPRTWSYAETEHMSDRAERDQTRQDRLASQGIVKGNSQWQRRAY